MGGDVGKLAPSSSDEGNFTTEMVEDCAVEVQHIFCTTSSGLQDNLDGSSHALCPFQQKKDEIHFQMSPLLQGHIAALIQQRIFFFLFCPICFFRSEQQLRKG